MAEPVKQPDISPKPAAPAAKAAPAAPKQAATAAKQGQAKPKASVPKQTSGKPRLEPLNVNLGRTGLPQESALPVKKTAPKPAPKTAPGAKPAAPAAKAAPVPKGAPAAKAAPAPKGAPVAKAAPRAKKHYFIIENLCVGCGLCLDKCPPKVNAIGYKFYGDVQEGGFRCYIDQDACISCSACFSGDECPSGALIEVLPDGQVLDFSFTPPDRIDFDLRFLHRFHREVR
ncbi:MAG: 4Fe-4S dicluster domain-containing protein [Chlorobium sp.]|jgi:photosystem P840 reaction center iron-sulfur protein|uniref:indolepyruvate ferredoxin oxidoreductase subunit alpha n=1 Tax=Chlorobium sp. TaxID=1095 RepID=UPI001DB0B93D|nr:4Fe-4S dicluster domain-containing protein [Chlorobium sp.]MBN1279860.1 4Fe-4S dicluster domain-containing protein [Chlorobiaceae bacterium]MCF8215786.1 4Fe-4S dicluster domain-containing protein [Chlorobium sp.]MCF8270618.1 4Fe-4S dicluster domain-containing protein [Chlorobium sp.]MCF8286996.1 4Fe-4S dicluster domain-containing protein [Chlorobium sp.]MCF8290653.1 4Fe-4S dicluster domain-containing protein [Chlorobium sp.]